MKNVGFCALSELDQKIGPNFPKHSKGRNQTMVFFMSCSRWGEGLTRSLYNIHDIITLYVMIIQQGSKIYYDQYRSTW